MGNLAESWSFQFYTHLASSGRLCGWLRNSYGLPSSTPVLVPNQDKLGISSSTPSRFPNSTGQTRKISVLLLICPRRFMETRKFPIEFPISSSFCLGEPRGSRNFLGVLLIYSSFCHLDFNQSQIWKSMTRSRTRIIVLLQGCRDLSAAYSLPYFRFFIATFGAKESPQVTKHNF